MHFMTKTMFLKISSSRKAAGSGKKIEEEDKCSTSKPNVNEEYLEAFRTKSFIDLYNRAQGHQGKISITLSSATSSLPFFMHLTDDLLEPRQETVTDVLQSFNVHHLLVDYFQASLEACQYCDQILERIHQTRLSYHKIKRVIKLSKIVPEYRDTDNHANDQTQKDIYRELALFASHNNPLAIISPGKFRDIHEKNTVLLHRLKSKRWKIRRRITIKRFCKKIGGIGLVLSHSALLIATLVLAFHSLVGLVAAPSIVGGLVGLFRKKFKWARKRPGPRSSSEKLFDQLDVAAKGVYIQINELDTLSRMFRRLHDEVEHKKAIANFCVKNGKREILKQVAKEFHEHDSSFFDQLGELEEHIYLCFLTINRSRTILIQEIMNMKG